MRTSSSDRSSDTFQKSICCFGRIKVSKATWYFTMHIWFKRQKFTIESTFSVPRDHMKMLTCHLTHSQGILVYLHPCWSQTCRNLLLQRMVALLRLRAATRLLQMTTKDGRSKNIDSIAFKSIFPSDPLLISKLPIPNVHYHCNYFHM